MIFRMERTPAFDYARKEHEARIVPGEATVRSQELNLGLASLFPLQKQGSGAVAKFMLQEEQPQGLRAQADKARRRLWGLSHEVGRRALHAARGLLAPLALVVHLHGPLVRDVPSLGPDPEVAHLRADGSDCRRPHH
jgi:hypothetical protein